MSLDSEIAALHARITTLEARERVQHAAIVASLTRERVSVTARQAAEATAAASVAAAELRAVQAEVAAEAAEARAVAAEAQVASLQRRLAAALQGTAERAGPGLPTGPKPARLAPVRGVVPSAATPEEAVMWVVSAGARVRAQAGGKITKERLQADDAGAFLAAVGAVRAAAEGTAARAQAHSRALAEMAVLTRKA